MFRDRTEAGSRLAAALAGVVRRPAVIGAIPRGGVAVALPIVERLRVPLAIVYARKLASRMAPELAVGALDEDGQTVLDARTVALVGIGTDELERVTTRVAAEMRRRMDRYHVPPLAEHLPGASVVLVDDGLATGLTMQAAIGYARRHGARDVTVAVPCASEEAAGRLRTEADRFVSLVVDPDFYAVGAYYLDFAPVSDEEVLAMLAEAPRLAKPRVVGMRLVFRSARGVELCGELLMPDEPGPHPVVVFTDGARSRRPMAARILGEALVGEGLAAFVFDVAEAQQIDDLRAAIAILDTLDDVDAQTLGVVGMGTGAAVAIRCAAEVPAVRALVLHSGDVRGAEDEAAHVKAPTLMIVDADPEHVVRDHERLAAALMGPRRLELVSGANLLENADPRSRAVALTVDWFSRHLGSRERLDVERPVVARAPR